MKKKPKQEGLSAQAIKHWPKDDRPREKLLRSGEHTLSNAELLAILLRSGSRGQSALDLARNILVKFKGFRNMGHTDIRDWKGFKGLGPAKIAQIKAAVEIARRFIDEEKESKTAISSSKEVAELFMPRMRDLKKEIFQVLFLDSRNRVLDTAEMSEGTVTQVHPIIREIISRALQSFAASLVCVHNHPSGDCSPSKEDRNFTRELCRAGSIMQVRVLDHIIIGDNAFYSFADKGELGE
ncbi:MAG: DNA repair protein RadC [Candidatus Omnitrophica bacterium]|nr:DNA repair protein RadC [Candidatus Omnitrophota bacterium]MBU4477626.1 DNA repair protein RadC [Candidatus Omnitrophota bacterium]MCG2704302.1 DNA repair protein RadC [Candidatus Omnitrophota bacterium]